MSTQPRTIGADHLGADDTCLGATSERVPVADDDLTANGSSPDGCAATMLGIANVNASRGAMTISSLACSPVAGEALPPELRSAPSSPAEVLASRLLAALGEAHASEEYAAADGFAFDDCLSSIGVGRRDRPATCYSRQWFFGAMGLSAEFHCGPPPAGGVVGVGILPHHQRLASSERVLGTAGFPGSVGCLVMRGAVYVLSDGRAVHEEPVPTSAGDADAIRIVVVVADGMVLFDVNGRRLPCAVALPTGAHQFRLGVSMDRRGQEVRFASCAPRSDWGAGFTFPDSCPSVVAVGNRFECRESKDATLYSYQTFRGGDTMSLKVRITGAGVATVGIGAVPAARINDCTFRSLGDMFVNSIGLLIHCNELVLRDMDEYYVVEVVRSPTGTVELELGFSDGYLSCAVQGAPLQLPAWVVAMLRRFPNEVYRICITVSGRGQSVEVLAASSTSVPEIIPPSGGVVRRNGNRVAQRNEDLRGRRHDDDGEDMRRPNASLDDCYRQQPDGDCLPWWWPRGRSGFDCTCCCKPYHGVAIGHGAAIGVNDEANCVAWWDLEREAARRAGREFIVRLQQAFCDDLHIRLVLVSEPGDTLIQVIDRWRTHPLDIRLRRVKKWARQLLLGVRCLMACGCGRNNVKPGNIVLTQGTEDVRIIDFGLCDVPIRSDSSSAAATDDVCAVGRVALTLVACEGGIQWSRLELDASWCDGVLELDGQSRWVVEDLQQFKDFIALVTSDNTCLPDAALSHPWLMTEIEAEMRPRSLMDEPVNDDT